ncbi:ABC-2 family transporter protein [Ruminococcus sp. YE71]|uniref:ABC transporter permease n=1 Tax=unclassified Ruminococcus TaxID=2608920 RepID=UPI00088A8881|nr:MULTISPECIES: ABC transporter permease [unclassified Ruminococcus]SDA28196.1 ABC-2 family transporter protein [Ruminococcus sp. YE78]SFW34961.1 ABC-2 family transporter protein [Ruminococcus sp. YE71]
MMLYTKECKKISRSVIYWIFCAIMVLFLVSQFLGEELRDDRLVLNEPQQGWQDYGTAYTDDPEIIMPAAANALVRCYLINEYRTYPLGFIHIVHLKTAEKEKMCMICEKITGMDENELKDILNSVENGNDMYHDQPDYDIQSRLTYEEFKAFMTEADSILGGGSSFAPEQLSLQFGGVPKTYEQAKAEYDELAEKDRFTNGYARLFCDYGGIFLSLLPVFVAAALCTSDKRSRMYQLIYSREVSSSKIVLSRFAALVTMLMLPVLVMALWSHIKIAMFYTVSRVDNLAFLKYTFIWLLPTVIAATGMGMLVTEFFSGIAAVFAQFVWWFASVMTTPIAGKISTFGFVVRHNTIGERDVFMGQMHQFTVNRLFFTAVGLVCALLTAFVYDLRRGGKFNGIRMSEKMLRHQSQS